MLAEDLDSVKVIDFSYSTPLDKEEFERCPDILKGFLDGTKQFMAPEQLDKSKFPLTDDFSKIDVWALGILLINMLTLNFPFANSGLNVIEDMDNYLFFMEQPNKFL